MQHMTVRYLTGVGPARSRQLERLGILNVGDLLLFPPRAYLDRRELTPLHQARPGAKAEIIHISIDPIKQDIPLWVYPTDILINADSSKVLPILNEMIRLKINTYQQEDIQIRFQKLQNIRGNRIVLLNPYFLMVK